MHEYWLKLNGTTVTAAAPVPAVQAAGPGGGLTTVYARAAGCMSSGGQAQQQDLP